MNVDKLVESIVKPFLEETYLEPMDTPAAKNEDNYPLGECGNCGCDDETENHMKIDECEMLRGMLKISTIPAIQTLSTVVPTDMLQSFIGQRDNTNMNWEDRNEMMADKIGYDLIDYIDGDERSMDVPLDDEHTFVDVSGKLCEEYSVRDKIRSKIQSNLLKKKFITENKGKLKSILLENNPTANTQGGTRDMAPFASLQGYKSFSRDRATITGFEIAKELFDDDQVFAVEDVELQFKANTIKIYGEVPVESNVVSLEESFKEIGNLYNEYVKAGSFDHAKDRDYDNTTSEFKDTKDDTPDLDDTKVPTGGDYSKLDGNKPTINRGYTEVDPKKKSGKSKVDSKVNSVNNLDEFMTAEKRMSTDGAEKIKMMDGGIGKGNNKESNNGTCSMDDSACEEMPKTKLNAGASTVAKKPYTQFTDTEEKKIKKKM